MKRLIAGFFYTFLIAALSLPILRAKADSSSTAYTGEQLIDSCNQLNFEHKNTAWDFCAMYVEAASSGTLFGAALGYAKGSGHNAPSDLVVSILDICMPENTTIEQYALVVTKYLHDHPAELNEPAAVLIYEAISQAWPCSKTN